MTVGPIILGHEVARTQFVDHGELVSFRGHNRTTGETWWRETRTGEKRGDCTVSHLTSVDPRDAFVLSSHVDQSGFASISDWQSAIADLHSDGDSLPDHGHLYLVTAPDVSPAPQYDQTEQIETTATTATTTDDTSLTDD